MSKSVLISIQPKWCELIASGKKTIEVRKTRPKIETPFKCYIYETKDKKYEKMGIMGYREDGTPYTFVNGIGKVIGEFVCDRIDDLRYVPTKYYLQPAGTWEEIICNSSCLSVDQIKEYAKGKAVYGWHISDLKIYDKPKELSEFVKTDKDDYCDINCKHLKIKGKPLSACDRYCDKYETYLFYNDSFIRCNDCFMDDCVITKAPQSWGYCKELEK